MMATAATARLRQDLLVTSAQDADGVSYFDVRDPRTGGTLRLFDFEWRVAERIDGERSIGDLCRYAEQELGFSPTPQDLEIYFQKLTELGLIDREARSAAEIDREARSAAMIDREAQSAAVIDREARSAAVIDREARSAAVIDSMALPVSAVPPKLEVVPKRVEVTAEAVSQSLAVKPEAVAVQPLAVKPEAVAAQPEAPALPENNIGLAVGASRSIRPQRPDDDVMGQPLAAMAGAVPGATSETAQDRPLEDRSTLLLQTIAGGERPTVPLSPVLDERHSASLRATEAGAESVGPSSERESRVARVTLPPAAAPPIAPAESTQSGETDESVLGSAQARLAAVAGTAEGPSLRIDTSSGEERGEAMPVAAGPRIETPTEKTKAAMAEPAPGVSMTEGELDEIEDGGRAGKWIAMAIILLVLAVAIYFLLGLLNPAVSVQVMRAQPHQVVRKLPSPATVKQGERTMLRMEGGGLLASVIGEGAEVSAGMSLAALQNQARLQKDITELRERLVYYQRRRDQAREKEEGTQEREATAKVNEKQERLAIAELWLKKSQILASRSGRITRVLVSPGEMITAGTEVLEIADRYLSAEMKVPAEEARAMQAGQEVPLQGPTVPVNARVVSVTHSGPESVVAFELSSDAAVKPGDELRLIKGQLNDVVELPSSAITEGDTVYVLSQGKAARRKVSVVDHDGANALVAGLSSGDEVIVTNLAALREGQAVKLVPL